MKAKILLIEDDPGTGAALQKVLRSQGYEVEWSLRGDEGLERAGAQDWDLVLTDLKMPGLGGMELVGRLRARQPQLPVILMTAHGSTETVIEATKLGACEYLTKPFEADELLHHVEAAVRNARRMSEPVGLGDAGAPGPALVGNSRAMQTVYKEIGRVAATSLTVLIRGATGTGKELIARAIWQHSDRAARPFIAVNCAAIPQLLLESELFGHERGAFTGAVNRRIGRFEQANGGTLFLDEIGDLSPETQAKLLRVLQEQCIQRVGGDTMIPVDVRVIAATHRDLEAAMREGEFREDLFFRLSVVTIHVPPLRERAEDIPELVRFFLRRHATDLGVTDPAIDPAVLPFLAGQPWPGNVRQLENIVRQALLLARPFPVGIEHIRDALTRSLRPETPTHVTHGAYLTDLLDRAERGEIPEGAYWRMIADLEPELFAQAIRRADGNQAKAARWLGITRLKMREKLSELGLTPGQRETD